MFVHRSNSLEELVNHLHAVVSAPGLGLLEPETVLIQRAGMERYLSRELARRSGITANVRFPFPRSFFHEVLDAALGKDPRARAFDRENLSWILFANLVGHVARGEAAFASVSNYLREDRDHSRRFLLAERLAHLFDQYVTYRPCMVRNWEKGTDEHEFQAILWRELVEQLGGAHFAARCGVFMNDLSEEVILRSLPSRVSLMGGPGLPPLFLKMLARIGQVVPTHVFSFSVCSAYFADAHPLNEPLPELGEGLPPLLVSLGRVGADYQDLLEMIGSYQEGAARFRPAEPHTVLGALQQSLIEGGREVFAADSHLDFLRAHLANDDSLTVDSCHSPLREIEVLHDRLLGWFAADPSLRPEDVVVLAPNIEVYSPLISAVFSARAGSRPRIPFRIADRSEKNANTAARAFLLGLGLLRGRLKASEVLDLLQLSPVRARYQIDALDLERVARFITDAGVRWGVDGAHREEFGLPNDDANTFRFGLRRLLLGYALPDLGTQLWEGTVPLDQVSVSDIDLVGRLCEFCENLFRLRVELQRRGEPGLNPQEWLVCLNDLLDATVAESLEGDSDVGAVRRAIHQIAERTAQMVPGQGDAHHDMRLGARGISHLLAAALDASRPSTDFLAGGVTFCALLPLRTIPFRGVCVLGLNQGEFPRSDVHHQLDLMGASPKRGDRSLRADDRYLFLEVLLAARERLAVSYVGRSVQDNSQLPPSVVLNELSAAVEALLRRPHEEAALKPYLRALEHPLQPFHPDYFRTGPRRLTSFDKTAYEGARALASEPADVAPFFVQEGGQQGPSEVELTLEQLVRFWKDPTKAFLEARGVRINDEIEQVEDREPILESALSRYIVGDRLLAQTLRGDEVRQDVELGRGELPVGQGGRVLLSTVSEVAHEILLASAGYRGGEQEHALGFSIRWEEEPSELTSWLYPGALFPSVTLTGTIDQIYGKRRLETSYGQLKASRKVALWVRHLAACAQEAGPGESVLVVRGSPRDGEGVQVFVLAAVERSKARRLLGELCQLAALGLGTPLRFFPAASDAYFGALHKKSRRGAEEDVVPGACESARKVLLPQSPSYRADPAIVELYRGADPLGDRDALGQLAVDVDDLAELAFARLAEAIFQPLGQAAQAGES